MDNLEEKCFRFVLHFYQKNKLDTQKALKAFKSKYQIAERKSRVSYMSWFISGAVAAACIGFFFYMQIDKKEEWQTVLAETYPVSYVLPDSSSVIIYPHSQIRFHDGDNWISNRNVQMRGKVRFHVFHNENSPFVVEGGMAKVKVLGTIFMVDESRPDTAVVEVESGKVEFSAIGQTENIVLTQGMAAQLVNHQNRPQVVNRPVTGSFVFDNTPLVKVLDELSRYYQVKLHSSSTDKRLTASFKDKSLDEIIYFIEKVLNVKIEKQKQ